MSLSERRYIVSHREWPRGGRRHLLKIKNTWHSICRRCCGRCLSYKTKNRHAAAKTGHSLWTNQQECLFNYRSALTIDDLLSFIDAQKRGFLWNFSDWVKTLFKYCILIQLAKIWLSLTHAFYILLMPWRHGPTRTPVRVPARHRQIWFHILMLSMGFVWN